MSFTRRGRPSRYFWAATRSGREQLCAFTPNRRLADKIEAAWAEIAIDHRAWDVLARVLDGALTAAALYDRWVEAKRNIEAMRRLLNDQNIEPMVADWFEAYKGNVALDSARHGLFHVRWLLPEGGERLASTITPAVLAQALSGYPGKRNTRRKVHSSWSMFFGYCTKVRGIYATNPLLEVDRPREQKSPIRFYELDVAERIVEWQPTAQRQALMALAYGAAIEVSVLIGLARSDFNPGRKEVRAAGTKAYTRDRVARIADWAWPTVWAYLATLEVEDAPLFPGVTRHGAGFWHRQTITKGIHAPTGEKGTRGGVSKLVKAPLALAERYSLHCARDHWAVMMLRSGSPVAVVQGQLGHESPTLTLRKYGRFMPSGADRDRWEKARDDYEKERRVVDKAVTTDHREES